MNTRTIFVAMALTAAILPAGCHFFENAYDDLPKDCPLNSGYPCPCELDEGDCDDGSACIFWGEEDNEGICSNQCDGSDDKESCDDTLDYGVMGYCWAEVGSDDYCIVVCKADGQTEPCPPGLECLPTEDGFSACFNPSAEDSTGDDDDDNDDSGYDDDDDNDDDYECECEAGEYECGDYDDILICEDGCDWTSYQCEYICDYLGYSGWTGDCEYSYDVDHDVCLCNEK